MSPNAQHIACLYPEQLAKVTEKQLAIITDEEIEELSGRIASFRTINKELWWYCIDETYRARVRKAATPRVTLPAPEPAKPAVPAGHPTVQDVREMNLKIGKATVRVIRDYGLKPIERRIQTLEIEVASLKVDKAQLQAELQQQLKAAGSRPVYLPLTGGPAS